MQSRRYLFDPVINDCSKQHLFRQDKKGKGQSQHVQNTELNKQFTCLFFSATLWAKITKLYADLLLESSRLCICCKTFNWCYTETGTCFGIWSSLCLRSIKSSVLEPCIGIRMHLENNASNMHTSCTKILQMRWSQLGRSGIWNVANNQLSRNISWRFIPLHFWVW